MQTAISSVTLAAPKGGPPLRAGVPAEVDPKDPFIKSMFASGVLTRVSGDDAEGAEEWSPDADDDPDGAPTT